MSSPAFAIPPDLTRDTGAVAGRRPDPVRQRRAQAAVLQDPAGHLRSLQARGAGLAAGWARKREKRITALPIWDIAVQTENRAGLNVCTYAESVPDPLLRKAIELNGFEERRHRHVLANLVEAYGIKLAPEPVYEKPKDPEWAFMVTGYSECIDCFFAFGLFKAAKDTGYFPPELVQTFDPVVNEEARHILFFVNWVAWHRRNMPLWRRPYFELKVLAVWLFLIYERMGIASDVSNGQQDNNFTVTGASQLGSDIDVGELIAICVAENDRRLAPYDNRLKRPRFVPFMARLALKFIGPKKKAARMKIGSPEHRDTFCKPFHADLYGVRSGHAALAGAGRGGADAPEIRALLGRGFLYRAPGRRDRRRLRQDHQRSGDEGSRGAAGLRGSPPRQADPGDDREIRHRCRRAPAGRCQRQCRNPLQGFRLRRVHGFLPGLRRLQDRHAVGIPAQGDVHHLRDPDVRGNPPHRLLRQLDGL